MKTSKEMFEELGYEYKFIDNKNNNCEDVILYTHTIQKLSIQFNLFSKLICMQAENKFKEYDKVSWFFTKEFITAINQQCLELGWEEV